MSKVCKYGCGVELGQFSTKENKFLEQDGKTLHTKERCTELKSKNQVPNGRDVELIESIIQGLQNIIVDLGKLK